MEAQPVHGLNEPARCLATVILLDLLDALSRARTMVDMNIAAGAACQQLLTASQVLPDLPAHGPEQGGDLIELTLKA